MPSNKDECKNVSVAFDENWNFPHCLGSIDGKHIVLQAPIKSGSEFYNYKSFFSIVLFALVDANYNFLFVDIGCQGRISDGGLFKNTELCKRMQNKSLNLPNQEPLHGRDIPIPYVFVGDKAFPLGENLMKPYTSNHPKGSIKRIFNYRLSRARRVVENAFGIVSSVFRCLRKPLLLQPETAEIIVMAIVHLHNFLRKSASSKNIYSPPGTFDFEENDEIVSGNWRSNEDGMTSMLPIRNVPRRNTTMVEEIRNELADFFMSNGKVTWQDDYA